MRAWRRSKLGRPSSSKATISPSSTTRRAPSERSQLAHLGVAGREVAEVAALELDVAVVAERHDPDPVPLDLESELLLARRQRPAAGHHRLDALRERLVRRIRRRIHAVDHPVALAGPEQGVAPVAGARRGRSRSPRRRGTSPPRRCRDPRRASCRRRTRPWGSRPRTRGTRAGGPRSARRGGSRPGAPARRAAAPTTQACRRARGAGPSGGGERGAPAPRSGPRSTSRASAPSAQASSRSRASPCRCRACRP